MNNEGKVLFKRTLGEKGESLAITIPKELVQFLGIEKGEQLTLIGEAGKKGKFVAVFKEQQE